MNGSASIRPGRANIVKEVKMRCVSLLLASAILGSCTTAAAPPMRSARAEQQYQQLLAGKVAQPDVSCLPSYRANDMVVIDENTVAFKASPSRIYVAHMRGACTNLGGGPYALVTHQYGTSGLCHGDIAQVMDTINGVTVGSCVFGDFTPYVRPGA
jgi:hypothetical protein